jgi:hypothetical protein
LVDRMVFAPALTPITELVGAAKAVIASSLFALAFCGSALQ